MTREPCRTYRRALLLDALDADTTAHPAECADCRRYRDGEREVAAVLAHHRANLAPPEALRERIAAALESERSHRSRPRSLVRRGLLAAALIVPVVVGLVLWIGRTDGKERADEIADLIVEDHLEYARKDDRLQIASASPAEMQGWFERELQIAAKLPELRGAMLVGGRRCKLGDRRAALAFYERRDATGGSEPVSLFVFEPRGEDWSGMREATGLAGKRACRHHDRGVGLLVWEERALVYVVAGALDADELAALIGH